MYLKLKSFPLLPRKKNTSKADYGHALILAGSRNMTGAASLSAEACLRSGAGLATLACPKSVVASLSRKLTSEIIFLPLPETRDGALAQIAFPSLIKYIRRRKISVLGVGPGLTHNKGTATLVRKLVSWSSVPVVLDADGLNAFQSHLPDLRAHKAELVLTPHAKEFERLFSEPIPKSIPARVALAKKLARLYDVTIVLKGHHTLVVNPSQVYKNNTGNPGMAKGGAGDVLTGMITAFIAQGLSPFQAASWAVYFHGKAGDLAVKVKGELSLLASDMIKVLPEAFSASNSLE